MTQHFLRNFKLLQEKSGLFLEYVCVIISCPNARVQNLRYWDINQKKTWRMVVHVLWKESPSLELTTLHLSRLQSNKLEQKRYVCWDESVNRFWASNHGKKSQKKMTPDQIHQPKISRNHFVTYLFFWFNPEPPKSFWSRMRSIWNRFRATSSCTCSELPRNCKWKCRNDTVVVEILEVNSQRSSQRMSLDFCTQKKVMDETSDLKKFQHFSLGLLTEQKHKSHHTVDSSKGE